MLLATYILHSADLSNPLAQPEVSKRTALAVSQEFDAQAAKEKELGLPVTVMVADSEYSKAKMEARPPPRAAPSPSLSRQLLAAAAWPALPRCPCCSSSPWLTVFGSLPPRFLPFPDGLH